MKKNNILKALICSMLIAVVTTSIVLAFMVSVLNYNVLLSFSQGKMKMPRIYSHYKADKKLYYDFALNITRDKNNYSFQVSPYTSSIRVYLDKKGEKLLQIKINEESYSGEKLLKLTKNIKLNPGNNAIVTQRYLYIKYDFVKTIGNFRKTLIIYGLVNFIGIFLLAFWVQLKSLIILSYLKKLNSFCFCNLKLKTFLIYQAPPIVLILLAVFLHAKNISTYILIPPLSSDSIVNANAICEFLKTGQYPWAAISTGPAVLMPFALWISCFTIEKWSIPLFCIIYNSLLIILIILAAWQSGNIKKTMRLWWSATFLLTLAMGYGIYSSEDFWTYLIGELPAAYYIILMVIFLNFRNRSFTHMLLAGLCGGLAYLCKTQALIAIAPIAVFSIFIYRNSRFKTLLYKSAAWCIGFVVMPICFKVFQLYSWGDKYPEMKLMNKRFFFGRTGINIGAFSLNYFLNNIATNTTALIERIGYFPITVICLILFFSVIYIIFYRVTIRKRSAFLLLSSSCVISVWSLIFISLGWRLRYFEIGWIMFMAAVSFLLWSREKEYVFLGILMSVMIISSPSAAKKIYYSFNQDELLKKRAFVNTCFIDPIYDLRQFISCNQGVYCSMGIVNDHSFLLNNYDIIKIKNIKQLDAIINANKDKPVYLIGSKNYEQKILKSEKVLKVKYTTSNNFKVYLINLSKL